MQSDNTFWSLLAPYSATVSHCFFFFSREHYAKPRRAIAFFRHLQTKLQEGTTLKSPMELKFNQYFLPPSVIRYPGLFSRKQQKLRIMFLRTHGVCTPSICHHAKSSFFHPSPLPVCRRPPMDPIRPPSGLFRQLPSPPTTLAPARDRPVPGDGCSDRGNVRVGGR